MSSQELLNPRTARVLLCVALAASGALLIVWQAHLTFLVDDWDLLILRPGFNAHVLLDPHARHLTLGPVLEYKAIQETFGMDSNLPYGAAATVSFLASVALLYVYVRRRVGDWVALAAVLPILVMGTAYEDLLSAFQIGYFASMAFGIAALLAIERQDGRGDVLACAFLVSSLAFSEIAIAFTAGVVIALVLQRGPERRAWAVAIPILLYAAWYVTFGTGPNIGPSDFSLRNVATSPPYVLDGFASSAGSLLGFGKPVVFGGNGGLDWGRPVLLALVVISIAWVLRRRPAERWWVLVPLAIGLTFWFLTAANFIPGRSPNASRYQYVGAVFLVMILAQLASGWRPGRRGVAALLGVSLIAAFSNFNTLLDSYHSLTRLTAVVRGGLAGLDITADRARPDLVLTPENSNFNYFTLVRAGPYLSAAEKYGSPAYSQEELAEAPEPARVAADKVMAAALPITLRPGPAPSATDCVEAGGTGSESSVVPVPPGGAALIVRGGAGAPLALRRYAQDSFPVNPGVLNGRMQVIIPTDRSSRPWQLEVEGPGPVRVCPL
jgi:uncharacterized membrane protein